jgi:hypothetical protein
MVWYHAASNIIISTNIAQDIHASIIITTISSDPSEGTSQAIIGSAGGVLPSPPHTKHIQATSRKATK